MVQCSTFGFHASLCGTNKVNGPLHAKISFISGANCIPVVPIVGAKTFLVTTTQEEVNSYYSIPQEFWNSGWQKTEWVNGFAILERAINTTNTDEYLKEIITQQSRLARASKAGLCKYGFAGVLPSEEKTILSSELSGPFRF